MDVDLEKVLLHGQMMVQNILVIGKMVKNRRYRFIYSDGSFSIGKWDTKNNKLIEDVYNIQIARTINN